MTNSPTAAAANVRRPINSTDAEATCQTFPSATIVLRMLPALTATHLIVRT